MKSNTITVKHFTFASMSLNCLWAVKQPTLAYSCKSHRDFISAIANFKHNTACIFPQSILCQNDS